MKKLIPILLFLAMLAGLAAAEPKTVRVLTVGNSFAENALTYLPELADAAGHTLIVGRANLGGCSLERHWRHVAQHEVDPAGKDGSPYGGGKSSLSDLLAKEKWDFVTIQQVSIQSHDLATFYPFARDLHAYIKERAPNAKIMAHQIWAYRVDDPRFSPENDGAGPHTHREMYEQVREAYHALAKELNLGLIPSGDAMFLADTDPKWGYRPDAAFDFKQAAFPALPDQTHSLHAGWYWKKAADDSGTLSIDGHHASDAGKYLLGCVWFETFYGESVVESPFVPTKLDPAYAKLLREKAHEAVTALK